MSDTTDNSLRVTVEFSGGAELLFDNQRKKQLILPKNGNNNAWNLRQLIDWLKVNHLKERPELFVSDSGNGVTVRPGILVLVNDVDWELLGETDYQINNNDSILFISTLHGG